MTLEMPGAKFARVNHRTGPWMATALLSLLLSVASGASQNMTPAHQRAQQTARELAERAARMEATNGWSEALPLRQQLAATLLGAFGEFSPETDKGRRTVADSLAMLGRYYDIITSVTMQPTRWAAPRGSLDPTQVQAR